MKKDDIFKWAYTDKYIKNSEAGLAINHLYWCKSKIAIFDGKNLLDTFLYAGWGTFNIDSVIDLNEGIYKIEFIANKNDLKPIKDSDAFKYRQKDIVNLNHANSTSGNMYVFKTASIDGSFLIKDCESEIQKAMRNIEHLNDFIKDNKAVLEKYKSSGDFTKIHRRLINLEDY